MNPPADIVSGGIFPKENPDAFRHRGGARGGSRTRTPLRALAPEASESTNSTTRASGLVFRGTSGILPRMMSFVNSEFCKSKGGY